MSVSEVARLRQQIQLEYEAVQRVFTDITATARHDFIETRQANLGAIFEELSQLMPKDEAIIIFLEASEGMKNEKQAS